MNKIIFNATCSICLCASAALHAADVGKDNADKSETKFSIVSSVAVFSAANTMEELVPIVDRFDDRGGIKQYGPGNEFLVKTQKNFAGCWFPSESSSFKNAIAKGVGLLVPVYRDSLGSFDSKDKGIDSIVDWPATEKLHNTLTQKLKLNLLPMSKSRDYWTKMQQYILDQMLEDKGRYLDIARAGGGMFGQLFGSIGDKNGSYSKTKDPNYRLSGFIRPNYYKEVLSGFPDIGYVVNSNENAAITWYYSSLQNVVANAQDKEALKVNLEKDVSGTIHESLLGSTYYYFGMIDEKRASNSSMMSLMASSIVKVNFHTDLGDDKKTFKREVEAMKVLSDIDEFMFHLRSNHGSNIAFSLVEKYKEMSHIGVDNDRVFCGAYDESLSKEIVEISTELKALKEDRASFLNPLVFQLKVGLPGFEAGREEASKKANNAFDRLRKVYSNVVPTRAVSEELLASTILPASFRESGYSGFIASSKLK